MSGNNYSAQAPRFLQLDPTVYAYSYGGASDEDVMDYNPHGGGGGGGGGSYGRPAGDEIRTPLGGAPMSADSFAYGGIQAPMGGLPEFGAPPPPPAAHYAEPAPEHQYGQPQIQAQGQQQQGWSRPQMRSRPTPTPRPETPQEAAHRAASQPADIQAPVGFGAIGFQTPPGAQPRSVVGFPAGHPAAGQNRPFMGVNSTMPMEAGQPTFRNGIGAYAAAPPTPPGWGGQGFPQAVPGVYTPTPGFMPPGGAFGDLGAAADRQARRAQRQAEANKRVVQAPPYIYEQHSDGSIFVLKSGDPRRVPHGSQIPTGSVAWKAITGEIGSWQSYIQDRRRAGAGALSEGLAASAQLVGAFAGKRGKGRKGRKGRRGQGPVMPEAPPLDMEVPVEEPSSFPSWLPIVGLVAVGGLVLASMAGGGKKGS